MTDPTSDRDDDLLRDALRAEAEGVTAGDDLLERIRTDAAAPAAPARRSRLPVLLAAAAVLAVLALAAALLTGTGDDERVDLVDTPDPTAPTETTEPDEPEPEPGDDPSASAPTTEADGPVEPGPRPDVIVGVTADGRLVVVDVDTGEELRELWALGDPADPADPETGIPPNHISGVALHPEGQRVFVEVCCEPAGGNIYVMALDGSDDGDSSGGYTGYGMDASADGRWLAAVSTNLLMLHDLTDPHATRVVDLGEAGYWYSRVAVNHDATEVAFERGLEHDERDRLISNEVDVFRIEGDDLVPIRNGDPRQGRHFARYIDRGRQLRILLNPDDQPPRSMEVDATGTWDLFVLADGTLSGTTTFGDQRDVRIEVPTDLRFVAADW